MNFAFYVDTVDTDLPDPTRGSRSAKVTRRRHGLHPPGGDRCSPGVRIERLWPPGGSAAGRERRHVLGAPFQREGRTYGVLVVQTYSRDHYVR